jgi:hypothetical protein
VTDLKALVSAELAEPVDPRVTAMATAIAAQYGVASRAVLFYGSCLRESQLDGLMLDFYLIVSDYRTAYPQSWLATANRLIPPNVFPFAHNGLAAKYAVLSEADFAALNTKAASTVSVWARFAQPTRLVWVADDQAYADATAAVAEAAPTLLALSRPLVGSDDPLDPWREGFTQTYACELRAERGARPASIVDAQPERYRAFAEAVPHPVRPLPHSRALARWGELRRRGKLMSVARLAKASFTFAGGIDYLAWKISRHSGAAITIKPWQRRWPLIAALFLVPRLLMRGAIR